jgi:hypothetical protein
VICTTPRMEAAAYDALLIASLGMMAFYASNRSAMMIGLVGFLVFFTIIVGGPKHG